MDKGTTEMNENFEEGRENCKSLLWVMYISFFPRSLPIDVDHHQLKCDVVVAVQAISAPNASTSLTHGRFFPLRLLPNRANWPTTLAFGARRAGGRAHTA